MPLRLKFNTNPTFTACDRSDQGYALFIMFHYSADKIPDMFHDRIVQPIDIAMFIGDDPDHPYDAHATKICSLPHAFIYGGDLEKVQMWFDHFRMPLNLFQLWHEAWSAEQAANLSAPADNPGVRPWPTRRTPPRSYYTYGQSTCNGDCTPRSYYDYARKVQAWYQGVAHSGDANCEHAQQHADSLTPIISYLEGLEQACATPSVQQPAQSIPLMLSPA